MTFLSALLTMVAATAPAPRTYALIVSYNGTPSADLRPLRYADDDGVRYYELFNTVADRTVLLSVLDEDTQRQAPGIAALSQVPTRANLDKAFADINTAMAADAGAGRPTVFYLVYTGHGGVSPSHEGFVTLHDGRLTRTALYESIVGRSHATYNHIIIDACDSYFMVNSRGSDGNWRSDRSKSIDPALIAEYSEGRVLERYPNTGVLVSTAGMKESHEWSRYGAGVFSYEVRSALVGAADINGDGRIAYSELSAYVAAANLRVEQPKARLAVFSKAPAANLAEPLFDLRRMRATTFVRFDEQQSGHFELEDERGVRYLDLNKAPEHAVTVGLIPGPRYFVRRGDSEFEVPSTEPGTVSVAAGTWHGAHLTARDATNDALAQGLYQVAYGPSFYAGYVATSGDAPVAAGSQTFDPAGPAVTAIAYDSAGMSTQRILAWGAASVAVASATGAIVYWAVRDDGTTTTTTTTSDKPGKGHADPTVQQAITPGDSMAPTYVLAGIAAAAGITSAILFLTDHPATPRASSGPLLSFVPTPGGAYVASGLTF
jgi:hypothetical protein